MEIRKIPIEQIHLAPYNPRIMDVAERQKLKESMVTFGYVDPIIWNAETGDAVGGNQRVIAALELGFKELEVVVVHLSLAQEKILNIALNKISGRFDLEKLTPLLEEISKMPDIEFELTGFELPELSELLDRYSETKEDNFDFDAALESIKEPITQRGDLIQLGCHRILCGDSSNSEDLKTLMGQDKVDLLDCDFPYNVNYCGGNKPNPNTRPKKSRKWPQIYSDNMPQKEYEAWMKKVFGNIKQFLKPGSAIYVWQGHRQFPPMYQILLDLNFHISCVICWLKESAAITYADYCFRTEQCLYGWLEGAPHYWAGKPGESNVWEVKRDPTKAYVHPTQKPVELASRAIKNSSRRDDIVLDCFLGSGSVLIAAATLNRRCYGIELDARYCDAIVRRYINFVGADRASYDIRKKYLQEV